MLTSADQKESNPVYKLCKRGHVLSPENVSNKNRYCKKCRAEYRTRNPKYAHDYYLKNKTTIADYKKEYAKSCPEVNHRASKKYRESHPHKRYENLPDYYIRDKLRMQYPTKELIDLKRNQILLCRELRELKKTIKEISQNVD
jgi:hypothetical protein